MSRQWLTSVFPRRTLAAVLAAASLTVAVPASADAVAPGSPSPIPGTVLIASAAYPGKILCASPADQSVWLQTVDTANPYCQWLYFGALFNPAKGQVMTYTGGNEGAVVMSTYALGRGDQQWTWGGAEDWGGRALQSGLDSGQNVDAKSPDSDSPRTDPVRTRGWRHGHQRELTWNMIPLS